MGTREFSVTVPNHANTVSTASLTLEPVSEADLTSLGYTLPPERLEIRSAGLSTGAPASTFAGCLAALRSIILTIVYWLLRRPMPLPRPSVIRLEPRSSVVVRVAINTAGPVGAAALRLVDRRGGLVVGGVTMLVFAGVEDPPPSEVSVDNPCPIAMHDEPYWLPLGSDVDGTPQHGPLPAGAEVQLVVWVTNPTGEALADSVAYLEHLGGSPADFTTTTWNLGSFEPGATFPLRWRVVSERDSGGSWAASVVVMSAGSDPIRLRAVYELGGGAGSEPDPIRHAVPEVG